MAVHGEVAAGTEGPEPMTVVLGVQPLELRVPGPRSGYGPLHRNRIGWNPPPGRSRPSVGEPHRRRQRAGEGAGDLPDEAGVRKHSFERSRVHGRSILFHGRITGQPGSEFEENGDGSERGEARRGDPLRDPDVPLTGRLAGARAGRRRTPGRSRSRLRRPSPSTSRARAPSG